MSETNAGAMSIANLGTDPVADSEGTLLDMWPSRAHVELLTDLVDDDGYDNSSSIDDEFEDELDREFGYDAADAIRSHLNDVHNKLQSSKSNIYSPLDDIERKFRTIDRATAAPGSTQDGRKVVSISVWGAFQNLMWNRISMRLMGMLHRHPPPSSCMLVLNLAKDEGMMPMLCLVRMPKSISPMAKSFLRLPIIRIFLRGAM